MPRWAFALMVAGGLWLALWRTGWRRFGFIPVAAGAIWALATPAPDLIVTGDGKHLALRTSTGKLAILRSRAGDYVRDMLTETAGESGELTSLEHVVPCSLDLCKAEIAKDGRIWRILATRSAHYVPWREMARACAQADIVISDRRLPKGCTPRWLKADRAFLARTGGLAISLGAAPRASSVAEVVGCHPWVALSRCETAAKRQPKHG
jgi:competence protein ComEC